MPDSYKDGIGVWRCLTCLRPQPCDCAYHQQSTTKGPKAMPFKLFDVAKVGCYCETITHSTEKRKDGEVKVVQLSLRVQPFDAKLATALHPDVRTTLFKLSHPDPQPHIQRVNFLLGVPRQDLDCFATSETREATRRLEHVKISNIYARSASGSQGYALVLKATFGPVSDAELGYCEAWRSGMKFINFSEAEASDLFIDESEEEEDDENTGQQSLPDPDAETADATAPLNADTDRKASAERERAHKVRPRHATRHAAAKAKQAKGRGRR